MATSLVAIANRFTDLPMLGAKQRSCTGSVMEGMESIFVHFLRDNETGWDNSKNFQ